MTRVRGERDKGRGLGSAPPKLVKRPAAGPRTAAAPVRAAIPVAVQRAVHSGVVQCQSAVRVSSPRDPAEKEAESTAAKVMRMPTRELAVSAQGGAAGLWRKAQTSEPSGASHPR